MNPDTIIPPWREVRTAQDAIDEYRRDMCRALCLVLDDGWTFRDPDKLENGDIRLQACADDRWSASVRGVSLAPLCRSPFEALELVSDDVRKELARTLDKARRLGKVLRHLNALVARFDDGGGT